MHNPDNPNCSYKLGWSADSSTDFCSCDVKQKCSCKKCSALVSPNDYTFPECPQCYLDLEGVCE